MKTMKNCIQSIGFRTIAVVKIVAIAAVIAFAAPAVTGTSVATAQAWDFPRLEIRIGPLKLCPIYCWVPGYCCEREGVL